MRTACGSRSSASSGAGGPCCTTCRWRSRPGEVTALLGPNGAGKSTLVLAVAGSLRPTSGRVLLDDHDLTRRRPERIRRAGVAVVPEGRRLLPDLSVADNLRVATYSLEPEQAERGTEYALELFPELKQRWRVTARVACRAASSRWSCWRRRSCRSPPSCSSTSCRSGLAPLVVKRLVPIVASVAVVGRRGPAHRAVRPRRPRPGAGCAHPAGWSHPLQRDGPGAAGRPRAAALRLPAARVGR